MYTMKNKTNDNSYYILKVLIMSYGLMILFNYSCTINFSIFIIIEVDLQKD